MYIIEIKTPLSTWHYGTFKSYGGASKWCELNGYKAGEYKIIQLLPVLSTLADED